MTKHTLVRIAAAVILFVGGTTMLFMADGQGAKLQAQTNGIGYTTTWDADPAHMLTAKGQYRLQAVDYDTGNAYFGVWGWNVVGIVNGSTFKENWQAPTLTDTNFLNLAADANGPTGCNIPSTVSGASILVGCIINNTGNTTRNYQITSDTSGTIIHKKYLVNAGVGTGPNYASSCVGQGSTQNFGNPQCVIATGAYGLSNVSSDYGGTNFRLNAAIMVMPLHWQVIGTLCQGIVNPVDCHY